MKGSASQKMKVAIQKNGFLRYIPHPMVPHKESNYKAENTIYLEENATLIWGEILTCGRKLNEQSNLPNFKTNVSL